MPATEHQCAECLQFPALHTCANCDKQAAMCKCNQGDDYAYYCDKCLEAYEHGDIDFNYTQDGEGDGMIPL